MTGPGHHPPRRPSAEAPAVSAVWPRDWRDCEPEAPESADRGGRLLFVMVFWFCLATSLELWWLETPAESVATVGDAVTAAGRIVGMVAGFALLVQILLMSRVQWLERWIGAHTLMAWHREVGTFLLVAVLGHVALTVVGYAAVSGEPVIRQAWTMLTTYEEMAGAFAATGLLVAVGMLAIRAIRRAMPHELWYALHLFSYLVLLLGYGHQFLYGQELKPGGFGR